MSGRVVEVVGELGPWRWDCDDCNDPWHYAIADRGWAATEAEARALLDAHFLHEHTPERAARWSVNSLDPGEWWAWGPGRTFRHSPFPTWREAFDYADREARR